MPVKGVM